MHSLLKIHCWLFRNLELRESCIPEMGCLLYVCMYLQGVPIVRGSSKSRHNKEILPKHFMRCWQICWDIQTGNVFNYTLNYTRKTSGVLLYLISVTHTTLPDLFWYIFWVNLQPCKQEIPNNSIQKEDIEYKTSFQPLPASVLI